MGKGWGGAGGLGSQQSRGIQLAGGDFSGKDAGGAGKAGKEHQGEGVFSVSGVQVFAWRDRNWQDLDS